MVLEIDRVSLANEFRWRVFGDRRNRPQSWRLLKLETGQRVFALVGGALRQGIGMEPRPRLTPNLQSNGFAAPRLAGSDRDLEINPVGSLRTSRGRSSGVVFSPGRVQPV